MPRLTVHGWWLHPTDEQLAAYVDGGLVAGELDDVESHIINCEPCQTIVGETLLDTLEEDFRSDEA